MKTSKRLAALVLMLCMVMAMLPVAAFAQSEYAFADVSNTSWQYTAVKYAVEKSLMAGKGTDGQGRIVFDPNSPITREEFVQVLYNAEGKPAFKNERNFPDVESNGWYRDAVLWANSRNIASGMGNGSFGVGKKITRQDLAMMLYKYAALKGCNLAADEGKINQFADGDKVAGYAKTAMDWAVTRGVLNGKGNAGADISTFHLDPAGTATRAECAAMLRNFRTAFDLDNPAPTGCQHPDLAATTAKAETCTQNGNIAYWYCADCDKYFSDAAATTQIALADTVIDASGHTPGTQVTCTTPQVCTTCQAVLESSTNHSLIYVPEQESVDVNAPGNCAYWQCSVCSKCYLDQAAIHEIPLEETVWKYFKVTYICDENKSKQTQWYKVGTEIEDLLVPEIDGYEFNYWKDGYGKRINSIPATNTENIELYAVVTIQEYTIYLGGTWKYNSITYNIKQQVDLPIPVEDGLTFAGWRDTEGKVEAYTDSVGVQRWRIPKGTTGDVELMAQWKDNRNLVVPDIRTSEERYLSSGYDETEGCYWFLYSLGEIRNVVLDVESSLDKTNHEGGYVSGSLSLAETVTIEKTVGESISKTVSHTVTKSTDWSITDSWENSASAGTNVSVSIGAEVGPAFAKAKIEATVGVTYEESTSVGGSNTTGGGNGESDETSDTIESNFAYSTALSKAKERTITFSHDVAPGNYYYANVGTVKVFALVVFDPVKNSFGLETVSVLDDGTATAILSDKKENREYVSDALSYDVHIEGINNTVTDNFFVQYMANNAATDTNSSIESIVKMYPQNTQVQLMENPFHYTGYTFTGWKTNDLVAYEAGEIVENLAGPGQFLILNAQWKANSYTITYSGNVPENATAEVENIPCSENTQLNCRYDETVCLGSAPSLTGWTFGGWYSDPACTVKSYIGSAEEVIPKGNLTAEPNGTVVLYAKWEPISYIVSYDANGGSGTTIQSTPQWDTEFALSTNGFTRTDYNFCGWSTDNTASVPDYTDKQLVKNLAMGEKVTLYAVWAPARTSFTGREINFVPGNSHTDRINVGTEKETLIANGYQTLQVKINFEACGMNSGVGTAYAKLECIANNTVLKDRSWKLSGEILPSWRNIEQIFTINVSDLNADGSFDLRWSLPKTGNYVGVWILRTTTVTVVAQK